MKRSHILLSVFITLFFIPTAVLAIETSRKSSLSELNFNTEENISFKNIPWSSNDPFLHPTFKIKEQEEVTVKKEEKVEKEKEPPALNLSAILYSDKSSSAVINGRVLKVGNIINDQKIVEINKDFIKVDFNGKEYKVILNEFTKEDEQINE